MDIYKLNKIRPYKNMNFRKLLRVKSFFFLCKFQPIIKNLKKIYDGSSSIIGTNYTNRMIKYMYCDFLTGGSNFQELDSTVNLMQSEGLYSSIGFCREFLTKDEEHVKDYV